MFNQKILVRAIALTFLLPAAAKANDSNELEALRAEIQQMKQSYESRIQTLESRLQTTEAVAGDADKKAEAASVQASTRPAASNALNPDISLILSGTYANRSQDSKYHITPRALI
jgi:predicted component of type VI protein secretion system